MKHILYKASQYYALTKPRVAQLAVFCAVIGMCLAARGAVPWRVLCGGALGIWLCASAAFAVNCWVERHIDARMRRTAWRPSARGELGSAQILAFATLTGALGAGLLYALTNPLTLWLTLATFLGYAVVYTVLLKPATPQYIVIGGAVGAMPPALGWAAVTGTVPVQAWILVLIIFVWTPPHFWALALARRDDYARSGWPMLPLTHGEKFTRLHILLYSWILFGAALLPYAAHMSGGVYLVVALALGALFIVYAWRLWRQYSDARAHRLFRYSIVYLTLLFAALLVDHDARLFSKPAFQNIDLSGNSSFARDFALPDTQGRLRTLADFKGKVVVLLFGYTHCPDVCPTTLAELAQVSKRLGSDAQHVQVVFVTVDPSRDTPEALERYVKAFGPNFSALRAADPAALRKVKRDFRVHYAKNPGAQSGEYEMEHTAASYVFDPRGRLRLYVLYGQRPESWLHDLRLLLKEKIST